MGLKRIEWPVDGDAGEPSLEHEVFQTDETRFVVVKKPTTSYPKSVISAWISERHFRRRDKDRK